MIHKTFWRFSLCLSLLVASLSLAAPAHADGVVGTGTNASCTEAALEAALAAGGAITFNCGGGAKTFTLTSEKVITQDTVIEGGNVIYFNGGAATRLFRVMAPARLTLNDLYLQKGYSPNADGGAILNLGTLVLNHVWVEENVSGTCGGAIWTQGAVIISNRSWFENNSGVIGGGAICTAGAPTLQITNSHFQYNEAAQAGNNVGYGGAIMLNPAAMLTAINSEFTGNKAQFGGALAVMPGATATVRGKLGAGGRTFSDNSATHSGGAIYNLGSLNLYDADIGFNYIPTTITANGYGGGIASLGTLTLHNSFFFLNNGRTGGGLYLAGGLDTSRADIQQVEFRGNDAKAAGGGIYADNTTVVMTNTNFFNNKADGSGGGLACAQCARLRLSNSSFITNTAAYGGGLYVSAAAVSGYAQVRSTTFSGNQSLTSRGGGVYNQGRLELYFTTLANNGNGVHSVGSANTRFMSTALHNPGYTNCGSEGTALYSNDGANHVSDDSCGSQFTAKGDPQLGPLQFDIQYKYWSTYFRLPLAGSPLINLGHSTCPERDQRGAFRPDACDIGAVEFGGLTRVYLPLVIR